MIATERIVFLLRRMRATAQEACDMVADIGRDEFLSDVLVQRAVGMTLLMTLETAVELLNTAPDFAADHPEIAWTMMQGMRNRMAHGYFETDLERVYDAARNQTRDLVAQIDAMLDIHIQGE